MLWSIRHRLAGRPIVAIGLAGVVAQLFNLLAMPLLARMFDPADFGLFSIYFSFLSIFAVLSSMRYELAIPIPSAREDGMVLLRVAFWMNAVWASLLFAAGRLWPRLLVPPLDGLRGIWGLACLGILTIGIYQAITAWGIRERDYGLLASFRIHQGVAQPVVKAAFGWAGLRFGLILGDILGRLAASVVLVFKIRRELFGGFGRKELHSWWRLICLYRNFPLIGGWSGVLNTVGLYLPMLLFARLYAADKAGMLGLSQTLVGMPMILVGQALTQVYTGEIARLAREANPALPAYLSRAARKLLFAGFFPILAIAMLGPLVFGWVFGAKWIRAGEYVRLLAPMYISQFVSSPISGAINLLEAQGVQLGWDAARVMVLIGWYVLSQRLGWDDRISLIVYSWAMAVLYGLHVMLVLGVSRRRFTHLGPSAPKTPTR